jgi:hypothetical protein
MLEDAEHRELAALVDQCIIGQNGEVDVQVS